MLTVDNRQLQYRLDKIEADFRQEADKVGFLFINILYVFRYRYLSFNCKLPK
jgi:hypothetical protein